MCGLNEYQLCQDLKGGDVRLCLLGEEGPVVSELQDRLRLSEPNEGAGCHHPVSDADEVTIRSGDR